MHLFRSSSGLCHLFFFSPGLPSVISFLSLGLPSVIFLWYCLSSPYHTSHTRPSQHKPTQRLGEQPSTKPQIPPRPATLTASFVSHSSRPARSGKVLLRRGAREQEVEQRRDQKVGGQIKSEPVERFQAQNSGCDAQKETRYRTDIGQCLEAVSVCTPQETREAGLAYSCVVCERFRDERVEKEGQFLR